MKKIIIIFGFLIIGMACSEDIIDLTPISQKNTKSFYQTEADFEQAVIGVYDGLQTTQVGINVFRLSEERSDNVFKTEITTNYDNSGILFLMSSEEPTLADLWSSQYNLIFNANVVLERIDEVEFESQERKEQIIGEMKFVRALTYFDLVRYFGGVPLVTTPLFVNDALAVERSTDTEVYTQIIADLIDAIDKLPPRFTGGDTGRAGSMAAKALLGRVYVTRSGYPLLTGEWDLASTLFKDVIDNGNYLFFSNYDDIFDVVNDNGDQMVFSVQFKAGGIGEGNSLPTRNADNDIDPAFFLGGGSPVGLFVSQNLINSYDPADARLNDIRMSWVDKNGTTVTNRPSSQKFVSGIPSNAFDWDINWPVIRYTDVLMMHAETLNEMSYVADGEAFDILNLVRVRAGLAPLTSADVPTKEAFSLALEDERRHEFAFENIRWHDLVRTDRALTLVRVLLDEFGMASNFDTDKHQYIFPIPLKEIDINPKITQNPGY